MDSNLRPKSLQDFISQSRIKENLSIAIAAARAAERSLDHYLLYGPPVWARRRWLTSSPRRWASVSASPPARPLSAAVTWAAILTNLHAQDILFIDEIHRLGARA
jgi:Holliday junction DNA helicase RuvB